ncbi:MAG: radical SAM protein [Candidatus Latescibacterota bacterium]|nr:MAG: radical SAM protein [Candidatus Latescibacterota bacterium]
MTKVENIAGIRKRIFTIRLRIAIVFHFLPRVFRNEISLRQYVMFLRRLEFFLSKLQHNKFARVGRHTKIGLYIPGAFSRAFYTACEKFLAFNSKLPNTTVLISVTSACRYRCAHCYQKLDRGKDVDIHKLVAAARSLQDHGTAFFNIEGGEPFLRYDRLKAICEAIDDRSDIWVNSTGDGMTVERLRELKDLGLTAVMFSLHTPDPEQFDAFFGSELAWRIMQDGVATCHKTHTPVAFNICLQKEAFQNGLFEQLMDKSREFGAAFVQLIKPKSAGGWLDGGADEFAETDLQRVKDMVNMYNSERKYEKYPSISAQIIEEDKRMFGCTAGGTDRFYINAKGDVQPCEFLNISFGNIAQEDFHSIYLRMRNLFEKPGECWLCEKYSNTIRDIARDNDLSTLPLSKELSAQVYEDWNRGNKTELYDVIENDLTAN